MQDSGNRIGKGLSSLHRTTTRLLGFNKANPTNLEEFQAQVKRFEDDRCDQTHRSTLIYSYSSAFGICPLG
jgi:hypothetical protein